ncbi:TetR/AcrR family transcriptional regulator [Streptomyces aurantiogriseus]|uniref:TetR family transcriptional regulator n=1 Tax=Streptomyces aurantiogriseus TaxID=66870 RepID=A0A918F576_9ACTN|nr:TetR family transcriptional regulator [Streptomyces aurantiogriseus]
MEIAKAAARLFVKHGLKATRAEDIAQAAGIAPRTFYRYFATKEEAVAPLYAAGAQRWAEAVRAAPAELPLPEALEHAVRHTLTPGAGVSAASWEWARTLIRLATASPALGKVWAEVCHASEGALAEVLKGRTFGADNVAEAVPANGAGSVPANGAEPASANGAEPASANGAGSASASRAGSASANRAEPASASSPTPRQRFTAAVASAAVRVAVESWAMTDSPPSGAGGPAELALRNLEALRGFGWVEGRGEAQG